MFGYVKTDIPNMKVKDVVLYKAMYCGLCKGIGKCTNQMGRFCLSYDLTFLSLFMHNVNNVDVIIKKQHCVLHHIKKRPVALPDKLTERIGALNIILGYYKIKDDLNDEKKGHFKKALIESAYKKARKIEPKFDEIVKEEYSNLIKTESENSDSIDITSDPFGKLMERVFIELAEKEESEFEGKLAYNLGKWIYLIDALDDYDKDKKSGSFNVFANIYKEIESKEKLLKDKKKELEEIFYPIVNEIRENAMKIEYKFNHELIDNILNQGIFIQTKNVMENRKCKSIMTY